MEAYGRSASSFGGSDGRKCLHGLYSRTKAFLDGWRGERGEADAFTLLSGLLRISYQDAAAIWG